MKRWEIIRGRRTIATIDAESLDEARRIAVGMDAKNAGATIRRVRTPVGMRGPNSMMPADEMERRCAAAIDATRD